MGTYRNSYPATKPSEGNKHRVLHAPPSDNQDAGFATNLLARQIEKRVLMQISPTSHIETLDGGIASVSSGPYLFTIDADPSGNAVAMAAGGLVLKTGANIGDDTLMSSVVSWTPSAGTLTAGVSKPQKIRIRARLQVDDADKVGFFLGLSVATTDPVNADGTDLIAIRKAPTVATVIGRVKGNNGTARDSGTLATMADNTDIELVLHADIGSTAALSSGSFWVNGTQTKFTSAQVTALYDMLTTPQAMYAVLGIRTSDTNSRTLTTQDVLIEVDR